MLMGFSWAFGVSSCKPKSKEEMVSTSTLSKRLHVCVCCHASTPNMLLIIGVWCVCVTYPCGFDLESRY